MRSTRQSQRWESCSCMGNADFCQFLSLGCTENQFCWSPHGHCLAVHCADHAGVWFPVCWKGRKIVGACAKTKQFLLFAFSPSGTDSLIAFYSSLVLFMIGHSSSLPSSAPTRLFCPILHTWTSLLGLSHQRENKLGMKLEPHSFTPATGLLWLLRVTV